MKDLLLIARDFPPRAGGGVQRPVKLAKYLWDEGWRAHVVCAPVVGHQDPALLKDLPDEVRVTSLPVSVSQRGRRAARWMKLGRLYKLVERLALLGDVSFADLLETVAAGVIAGRGCAAVLATSLPFSSIVAGAMVAERLGVPFVADLRDPWAHAPRRASPSPLHDRLMAAIEAHTLARADAITMVTEQMRPLLPDTAQRRAVVIPNGFDPADLTAPAEARDPDRFRVVYTGSLYGPRRPEPLLAALEAIAPEAAARGRPVELVVAGATYEHTETLQRSALDVTLRGYLSHAEVVSLVRSADAISVLIGDQPADRHAASAKLYEAVAAGPAVVAWASPEGEAARVLDATGAGWASTTVEGMAAAYRRVLSGEGVAPAEARSDALSPWDRRTIARQFAGVLDEVVDRRSRP